MRKREILENFQNVGWALVFAVAIWLVMVQSQQMSKKAHATLMVTAPGAVTVQFPHPEQLKVDVTLRGAATDVDQMNRPIEGMYVVPEDAPMGVPLKIPVRDFLFTLDSPGIEIDKTELTQEVEVLLDQKKRGRLSLELDLDRTAPEGWELVGRPTLEPAELEASGPIAKMNQDPRIRTEPLVLTKILEKRDFDAKSRKPQPFDQLVSVSAPADIQVAQQPVKLSFTIRPKPRETEIELSPAIQFPGPTFQGLPWKLVPLAGQETVRVRVSGPELDLLDRTIEKTKEKFVCFVKPRPEFSEKNGIKPGGLVSFDVVVVAPVGIQLLSEPSPKLFRFDVKPLDPEDK